MAESISQTRPPQSSQYHHFVPRFLLHNFASFKNPGKIVPKTSQKGKNRRAPKPQKLTVLDLKDGDFRTGNVGDTFGIVDMYRDFDQADRDQHRLEKQLSALESAAAELFARVKRIYDAGNEEIQLSRKEKDLLRRFLFIMMYRNTSFAGRFEKSREDYDSDDRVDMLTYMDAKGFKNPRDVWFANIRAFLEVDLSKSKETLYKDMTQRAYPADAEWFIMHMQAFFLAFCTPNGPGDEFLLTQNAYSIYEGPHNPGKWTDWHRFAPVSPKVMIVLRSNLLPSASIEEGDDMKRKLEEAVRSMHLDPDAAGSWLHDLPISRARNNYSQIVDGRLQLVPTQMSEDKHEFYFPFFPLNHEHVQKINMLCLEEAADTIAIVYKSPESLRTALEFYLTDKTPGFKQFYREPPDDPNYVHMQLDQGGRLSHSRTEDTYLPYLELLHRFAQDLGSTVGLEYDRVDPVKIVLMPPMTNEQQAPYRKLGGTTASLLEDFVQANRIARLVTGVDSLIRNSSNKVKHIVRQNRERLIATLPPRRVWLSIKRLRHMICTDTESETMSFDYHEGKEDAIANASCVFQSNTLSRIIYRVFDVDFFLTNHPSYGLVSTLTPDREGAMHIAEEKELVFNKTGSIRDCGISAVEDSAKWLATQPRPRQEAMGPVSLYRILSEEQVLEIWMRNGVEIGFDALLGEKLDSEVLRALREVFFQLLYRLKFGDRIREGT